MEAWENIVISKVVLATYVPHNKGKISHSDRPSHGLVFNTPESVKDYIFSDGRVMHTKGGEVFYLPKGSTYRVEDRGTGGCYAINFEADIVSDPFSMPLRSIDAMEKLFCTSELVWRQREPFYQPFIVRSLYDIILQLVKEHQKKYVPGTKDRIIAPAMEKIKKEFNQNMLTVSELSALCGISEAYFRRIFISRYGISPKEYIISLRINYARELLESGQFSVMEAAQMCGYGEQCHFSREFSKRVGKTPSSYIRKGI